MKVNKNIKKIFFALMIEVITLSSFVFAKEFDKNGVYVVTNPSTRNTIICKGDGTVLMKTINPNNESLTLLYDEITDEPVYISKLIEGEKKIDNKFYGENGEFLYDYSYPSYRMEIYDLNRNNIGFNVKNISYISYIIGNKVVYYKDVDKEMNRHAFIYNIDTKKEEKAEYPIVESIKDKKVLFMSKYPYIKDNEKKDIKICDYDFNEIKKIDNYSYESCFNIDGKVFYRISTIKFEDGEANRYYNVLDEDYNFIFSEDLERGIYPDEKHIATMESDTRVVMYDFNEMKVIKDEKIDNADIIKAAKKIAQNEGYWTMGDDMYYKVDELNNKTYICDNKLSPVKIINKKYNYVSVYKYNDKKIYVADCGYYDEKKERYIERSDIYNSEFDLKYEGEYAEVFQDDGKIYKNNVFYNFDFDVIKDLNSDDNFKDCRLNLCKVGDKVFYENRYTEDYKNKEKYSVYDNNLNAVYKDIENSNFYFDEDIYTITKDNKTVVYNKDGKVIKKFDEPLDIYKYYGEKYYTSINLKTNRRGVLDDKFNELLSNYKNLTDFKEDYCTYQNGFKYGLVDYKGNVLLSFSIFDTMAEDTKENYGYEEYY